MKVRDKNVKQMVDVSDKECPKRECYWPRPDPGVFTQGVGYRTRYPGRKPDWLCGNREIRGCPEKYCHTSNATGERPETDAIRRWNTRKAKAQDALAELQRLEHDLRDGDTTRGNGEQCRSAPELSAAIKEANEATRKAKAKPLPKYEYPPEAITAAYLRKLAAVPYRIERHEAHGKINGLDHQRQRGKTMFGGGYLVSRAKGRELRAAEQRAAEERTEWRLSERERRIIEGLGAKEEPTNVET